MRCRCGLATIGLGLVTGICGSRLLPAGLREGILQSAHNRCLDRRRGGFDELPHVLEFLKDSLAVDAKVLG
jgi:hypothetical protein